MPIKKIRGIGIPTLKLFSLSAVFNSNNLLHRAPPNNSISPSPDVLHPARRPVSANLQLFPTLWKLFYHKPQHLVPVRPGCMLRLRPHKTEIPTRWSAYGPKHMLLKPLAPQPARSDYPPDPGQAAPLP